MSEKVNAPGKGLLKVSGIIGIIFAGIGCLVVGVTLMTIDAVISGMNMMGAGISSGTLTAYYVFALFLSIFGVYVYLMGILNCDKLEKASSLKTLGIIYIVITVIGAIVAVNLLGFSAIAFTAVELILPILYIVGASRNISSLEGNQ